MIDAALKLASAGTSVFPVGPDKKPRTPRGFYDATTDEDTIRAWDWTDCMIAIAIDPGTVILDVDPRNGGDKTLQALRAAGHEMPETKVAWTKSQGYHYYLNVPPDLPLRSGLGPGIDVKRAGKGYVIVPPSAGYRWLKDVPAADAPEWLLEELKAEEREGPTAEPSDPKFLNFEEGTAYGMAALERECGKLAAQKEGGRNDALNAAAFSLGTLVAGGELNLRTAVERLASVAKMIGLEDDEIKLTIHSGMKAGEKTPRQAPERKDAAPAQAAFQPRADATMSAEEEGRFWMDWEIEEPPPPYYLEPIIPKNAYILVFGPTEASKSMVFLALCAQGSWEGHKFSFYSLENPPHVDRGRVQKWRPNKENFRITHQPVDLNDAAQLTALIEREKEWGTDVLLLDTYSHAFGSRSEDGNARAIEFARRIRYLMQEVGCSVIVIDHTGYGDQQEPRDASAKRQQVDQAILMQKNGEWQPGAPARFTMVNRKSARFGNPFAFGGEIQDVDNHKRLELVWTSGGHGPHGGMPEWDST